MTSIIYIPRAELIQANENIIAIELRTESPPDAYNARKRKLLRIVDISSIIRKPAETGKISQLYRKGSAFENIVS